MPSGRARQRPVKWDCELYGPVGGVFESAGPVTTYYRRRTPAREKEGEGGGSILDGVNREGG
eukprot:9491785-Pyramimonas_sp.AAC.1